MAAGRTYRDYVVAGSSRGLVEVKNMSPEKTEFAEKSPHPWPGNF